ncbi:hypothetical protein EYB25_004670 [Talaromyces marneffei]|nr:hypothetical protein EYB25_004670 [Talaromyces marneffei]
MAMSLEDLPRIIRDYDTTERAEHQHDLIASCLKRILRDLKLNSNHEPREDYNHPIREARRATVQRSFEALVCHTSPSYFEYKAKPARHHEKD